MAVVTTEMLERVIPSEEGERLALAAFGIVRASGDVVCETCGRKYYDHPMDQKQLAYDGRPFLHVACDGTRLKL